MWMGHIVCICSPVDGLLPVDGHLGGFHLLGVVTHAAMKMRAQVFVWTGFPFSWAYT